MNYDCLEKWIGYFPNPKEQKEKTIYSQWMEIKDLQKSGYVERKQVFDSAFFFVKNLYTQSELSQFRFYHTWHGHIHDCALEFQQCSEKFQNPGVVFFALVLHDIFYDVKQFDNEEKSAYFGYMLAMSMGFSENFARRASDLILLTKHQTEIDESSDPDAAMFLDIDMCILGKGKKIFDEYTEGIHQEYLRCFGKSEFFSARVLFLETLMKRKQIFHSEFFRQMYEKQARENIAKAIKQYEEVLIAMSYDCC